MLTYRTETVISEKREITVRDIPFPPGEKVEVIILERPARIIEDNPYPLRGTPVQYDRPFDSVAEDEWLAPR